MKKRYEVTCCRFYTNNNIKRPKVIAKGEIFNSRRIFRCKGFSIEMPDRYFTNDGQMLNEAFIKNLAKWLLLETDNALTKLKRRYGKIQRTR